MTAVVRNTRESGRERENKRTGRERETEGDRIKTRTRNRKPIAGTPGTPAELKRDR